MAIERGKRLAPIPNPEAKPLIADNTADFICGNVGRCLVRSVSYFLIQFKFTLLILIIDSFFALYVYLYNYFRSGSNLGLFNLLASFENFIKSSTLFIFSFIFSNDSLKSSYVVITSLIALW